MWKNGMAKTRVQVEMAQADVGERGRSAVPGSGDQGAEHISCAPLGLLVW